MSTPSLRPRGDHDPRIQDLMEALMREARKGDMDVDLPVYERSGLDPTTPVLLGSGTLDSRVGFFGRDPGRFEIEQREPFIGKGGAMVRNALHRARFGIDAPNGSSRRSVGQRFFWANTVPFKPTGNKAWSVRVKRRFVPIVRTLLVERWMGTELITFGNVAFDWFRLAFPAEKDRLREFWAREDRYDATFELPVPNHRTLRIRPLPHPSPLNATWYGRLPAMLDARLAECGVGPED